MDQSRIARQVDDAWLEDVYRDLYPRAKVATWKAWAAEVRRIDVEIHPGGRAVLRHPDARWSMELRWRPTDPNKTGYASQALLTTCWITADPRRAAAVGGDVRRHVRDGSPDEALASLA